MTEIKNYYNEVNKLIDMLGSSKSQNSEILQKIQLRLDALSAKYQNDPQIGNDVYLLYQAQAMICYRQFEDQKAIDWMNDAIQAKGATFKFADEFIADVLKHKSDQPLETKLERHQRVTEHYSRIGGIFGIVIGIYGAKLLPFNNFLITVLLATIFGIFFRFISEELVSRLLNKK